MNFMLCNLKQLFFSESHFDSFVKKNILNVENGVKGWKSDLKFEILILSRLTTFCSKLYSLTTKLTLLHSVINSHAETKREAVTLFMWLYVLVYQKHFFSWENLTMDWTKQSNFRIDPFSILTYKQVIKILCQKRLLLK